MNLAGNFIGAILAIHLPVASAFHLGVREMRMLIYLKGFVKLVKRYNCCCKKAERRPKVETQTVAFQVFE